MGGQEANAAFVGQTGMVGRPTSGQGLNMCSARGANYNQFQVQSSRAIKDWNAGGPGTLNMTTKPTPDLPQQDIGREHKNDQQYSKIFNLQNELKTHMKVGKVQQNTADFHAKTKALYSQLQSECQHQFSVTSQKLQDQDKIEDGFKIEMDKRKFKRMADKFEVMEKMAEVATKQDAIEQNNPSFTVVNTIQYEDFAITDFQKQLEYKRKEDMEKAVENKIQYTTEMQIVEVLSFLDADEDDISFSEKHFQTFADSLQVLGVRKDDIAYLKGKMVTDESLSRMDIKFIQQEMAFFILNAEFKEENKLENLDYDTILEIVQSKIDPDYKINTLMNKVQRMELYTKEFFRLLEISDLTLEHKNTIIELVNLRDLENLKQQLHRFENMGQLSSHIRRYLWDQCKDWPNYIKLDQLKAGEIQI